MEPQNQARSKISKKAFRLLFSSTALVVAGAAPSAASPLPLSWITVVNNSCEMPGQTSLFNSYNPPSVNKSGLVVFRARSKGGDAGGPGGGEPARGVYTRLMSTPGVAADACGTSVAPIAVIADGDTQPPTPVPTDAISGQPVTNPAPKFTEFPAFPRIAATAAYIGFRGQSEPIWQAPDDTRLGTSSIYVHRAGALQNAVATLGALSGFAYLQVPGASSPHIKFDQFPGAPSPTPEGLIVFKGNYTDGGVGKTGAYFRKLGSPVRRIADTNTRIPNQDAGGDVRFGSVAPPSAASGKVVFAGFDNEDAPTLGGIYRAAIAVSPPLTTLVGIGDPVPSAPGAQFTRLGEAVSFDGAAVSFWGGWGPMKTVTLTCPTDGNADLIQACRDQCPQVGAEWVCTAEVPENQGVFLARNGAITPAAKTGDTLAGGGTFTDFLFWTFSGRPPGAGGGDEETDGEPPRWRASAFAAVLANKVAFKGGLDDGSNGLFLRVGTTPIQTLARTTTDGATDGTDGAVIDPASPAGSKVVAVGIERDGLRGKNLTINVSMLNALGESWAGIYLAILP